RVGSGIVRRNDSGAGEVTHTVSRVFWSTSVEQGLGARSAPAPCGRAVRAAVRGRRGELAAIHFQGGSLSYGRSGSALWPGAPAPATWVLPRFPPRFCLPLHSK